MGVGVGVVLLVVGAILYWAVEVDIPGVSDNTLGIILMVVGVIAIVLALITNQQRSRTKVVEERRDIQR
ncbi:MAG TPA: DUF6458 family protein [Marmoricola sp.]|jgi:hypothetical protein